MERWEVPAAMGLAALILCVNLLLPLGFDNDIYQSMGWVLAKQGGLPYLASWDHNFPGIAYIHALGIFLFGNDDLGFKLLDTIIHVAMAGLFYSLIRRWLDLQTSIIAVTLWTAYYTAGAWGLSGQRDGYAVGLLLIPSLLLFRMKDGTARGNLPIVVMGVCAGGAFLMRPTYALFALVVWVMILHFDRRGITSSAYAIGVAIPILTFLLPYLNYWNGLQEVYYSLIRFNVDLYANTRVPIALFTSGRVMLYPLAIVGAVSLLRTHSRSRLSSFTGRWVVLLILASLISVIVMGKYFTYHFEPLMAVVVVFSAIGVAALAGVCSTLWQRRVVVMCLIGLFFYFYYPRHLLGYFVRGISTGHPLRYTYNTVLSDSLTGLAAQRDVISYLDTRLERGAPIEYASFFLGLKWRSERPEATRFTTPVGLCIERSQGTPEYQAHWRKEFVQSIATVRPRYVVRLTGEKIYWPFVNDFQDHALSRIAGFDSLLRMDYTRDTVIRGYTLYRLRS